MNIKSNRKLAERTVVRKRQKRKRKINSDERGKKRTIHETETRIRLTARELINSRDSISEGSKGVLYVYISVGIV